MISKGWLLALKVWTPCAIGERVHFGRVIRIIRGAIGIRGKQVVQEVLQGVIIVHVVVSFFKHRGKY